MPFSEKEIYQKLISGNKHFINSAISELMKEYYPKYISWATQRFKGIPESEIEDTFIESIVILYENICTGKYKWSSDTLSVISRSAKLKTYLFNICDHKLQNKKRHYIDIRLKHKEGIKEVSKERSTLFSQENNLMVQDQKKVIQEALKLLSDSEGCILRLYYFDENSVREIANELNLKEGSVKSLKLRAMRKLKEILSKKYTKEDLY